MIFMSEAFEKTIKDNPDHIYSSFTERAVNERIPVGNGMTAAVLPTLQVMQEMASSGTKCLVFDPKNEYPVWGARVRR